MITTHHIENITFSPHHIVLQIDGKRFEISLEKVSAKLNTATEVQRNFYKVSPSGYGIHWPLIDEDLSVDALLQAAKHE